MTEYGKIHVLEERVEQLTKQAEKHEKSIERLTDNVGVLNQQSTETKVYVSQIFNMLEDIKTQLRILGERGDKTKDTNSTRWIDFFKQITFLALGAAAAYLFAK